MNLQDQEGGIPSPGILFDAGGRITLGNQYTAVGGVTQAHDGTGNLKDDGTYLYEYTYRSLLCRVKLKSDNSTVATYVGCHL